MSAVVGAANVKNVLVCETPSPESARLMRELSGGNFSVTLASNLEQARQLAAERDFDVALIEVDLPRRSSLGLLRSIHQRKPATKVLMMTDYGDEELWVDVVNEGASDLLCRPVRRCDLERSM